MEILSILLNRQAPLYLRLSILPVWPPRRHFCLLSVYLRLIQFPVCSDRPSEHPGARKAVMDELRDNSEMERGKEHRSPLPEKDLLQGARWMKSAFVSLLVIVFPCALSAFLCNRRTFDGMGNVMDWEAEIGANLAAEVEMQRWPE